MNDDVGLDRLTVLEIEKIDGGSRGRLRRASGLGRLLGVGRGTRPGARDNQSGAETPHVQHPATSAHDGQRPWLVRLSSASSNSQEPAARHHTAESLRQPPFIGKNKVCYLADLGVRVPVVMNALRFIVALVLLPGS